MLLVMSWREELRLDFAVAHECKCVFCSLRIYEASDKMRHVEDAGGFCLLPATMVVSYYGYW